MVEECEGSLGLRGRLSCPVWTSRGMIFRLIGGPKHDFWSQSYVMEKWRSLVGESRILKASVATGILIRGAEVADLG